MPVFDFGKKIAKLSLRQISPIRWQQFNITLPDKKQWHYSSPLKLNWNSAGNRCVYSRHPTKFIISLVSSLFVPHGGGRNFLVTGETCHPNLFNIWPNSSSACTRRIYLIRGKGTKESCSQVSDVEWTTTKLISRLGAAEEKWNFHTIIEGLVFQSVLMSLW